MQEKQHLKLSKNQALVFEALNKANKPVGIQELQSEVWGYQSQVETHTVETHIYRLRKKILKVFKDDYFIISNDNGYEINKKK